MAKIDEDHAIGRGPRRIADLATMPWPWDRNLQDDLECFGRTAPGTNTVVPLSAGARPLSQGERELVAWPNGLKAR